MATFPIIYQVFSDVLDKPTYVVVVKKSGSFKSYRAGFGPSEYDSSDEYIGDSKNVFDDPRRGISNLPIGARNLLGESPSYFEGASDQQIKLIVEEVTSITAEEINAALEKSRGKED